MGPEMVITVLSGSAAAAVVSGVTSIVLWWLNNRKKKSACEMGLQILLYDRIKHLGLHYIEDGEIYAEDLEDLQRMHKVYHDTLAGNGYLDNIMKRVNALPLKQ